MCNNLTHSTLQKHWLKKPIYNQNVFVYLPHSFVGDYNIPEGILSIAAGAFDGCEKLTSISIPNSIKSIGDHAFRRCDGLKSVIIPNSVDSVGSEVFFGCDNIEKPVYNERLFIFMPENVTEDYVVPDGISSILSGSFHNLPGTSITIPKSVNFIADGAFNSLHGITVNIEMESIEDWLRKSFNTKLPSGERHLYIDGEEITSVVIPNTIKRIEADAFASCCGLTNVVIPNTITSIGKGAFYHCYNIKSIDIPNSVKEIEKGAFCDCSGLESATIGNSVTRIEKNAFDGTNLTSIVVPNTVKYIGDNAFGYKCNVIRK